MKKYLSPLAVGIMMLTACTSEEVTKVSPTQGNVISFENVLNKNTRAEVGGNLTNTTFDKFLVYGYYTKPGMTTPVQIFYDDEVTKGLNEETNAVEWTYNGTRYWVPGYTYYFYAYSCADIALAENGEKGKAVMDLSSENTTESERALVIQNYLCDSNHQHDLVCAEQNVTAKEKGNDAVGLNFGHALCKIKATFTTDFPDGYNIKISNVKITDFYNKASYNVEDKAWSGFKFEGTPYVNLAIAEGDDVLSTGTNNEVETAEIFLLPKEYETAETVAIHFSVKISYNDDVILERNIKGTWAPQWKQANIYNYTINLTGSSVGIEPIVFAASQELGATTGSSWNAINDIKMSFSVEGE